MANKDTNEKLPPRKVWKVLSSKGLVPFKDVNTKEIRDALDAMGGMRELGAYISEYGLGYAMRIKLAIEVLELKTDDPEILRSDLIHALEDHHPKPVGTALMHTPHSTLRTFLHLGSKKEPPKITIGCFHEIVQALCYLLHYNFGGEDDEVITPHEFQYNLFNKKTACEDFIRRLKYGVHNETTRVLTDQRFLNINEGLEFYIGNNLERQEFHRNLKAWVDGNLNPEKQLGVIHSPHSWTGLQSLALDIHKHVSEPARTDYRVIYIPLSTYGALRKNTPTTGLSYGEILAVLERFVDGKPIIQNPAPIKSARKRSKTLLHIRRQLAKKPALIILSGYSERSGHGAQIKRIIKDDLVITTLIPNLLMPPTWYRQDPYDSKTWARNKILLLGDKAVDNETFVDGPQGTKFVSSNRSLMTFNAYQDDFPRLPVRFAPAVFQAQNYSQKSKIKLLRDKLNIPKQDQHECVNHSLEALIAFQRVVDQDFDLEGLHSAVNRKLRDSTIKQNPRTHAVMSVLFDMLSKHSPAWLLAIQFIALSPGGIREQILVDLLHRFALNWRLKAPKLQQERSALEEDVKGLLKQLKMIVSLGRIDEFEGAIEDEDLGELKENQNPKLTKSYVIASPEIRETILVIMKTASRAKAITQSLSILLCEESFRQQAESIKKRTSYTDGRIGPYRRTIQGIYHGLESIRAVREKGELKLKKPDLRQMGISIPLDPLVLWRHLYAFHFKKSLVRHSEWRLSRYFSRNQLKHELLSCFERPWLLDQECDYQNKTIFDLMPVTEPNQDFLDDLSISKAHATMILSLPKYQLIGTSDTGLKVSMDAKNRMQKHLYRSQIDEGQYENVITDCDANLSGKAIGLNHPALLDTLDTLIETGLSKCMGLIGKNNFNAGYSYNAAIKQKDIDTLCEPLKPKECRQLIDLLNRKAEAIATTADLSWGEMLSQEFETIIASTESGRTAQLTKANAIELDSAFLKTFRENSCRAFVIFEVAEHVRKFIFNTYPHLKLSQISGHATRTAIRQSLVLEREARNELLKEDTNQIVPYGIFAGYARMLLDELSRHLGRFLSERLHILTLEATFIRLLRHQEKNWGTLKNTDEKLFNLLKNENAVALDQALLYLNRAERIMMFVSPTSTGRIRFYNERQKIYRLLPLYKGSKFTDELLGLAGRDIAGMQRLANVLDTELWSNIASIQSSRLKVKNQKNSIIY